MKNEKTTFLEFVVYIFIAISCTFTLIKLLGWIEDGIRAWNKVTIEDLESLKDEIKYEILDRTCLRVDRGGFWYDDGEFIRLTPPVYECEYDYQNK